MSPSIALTIMGTDQWNATAYSAVSVAYRISGAVRDKAAAFRIASKLWRLNKLLAAMMESFYSRVEKAEIEKLEPPSAERIQSAINAVMTLLSAIERMSNSLKDSGLNRGIVGLALNSVLKHADDIADLTESVDLRHSNPDIDSIFEKSLAELKAGATHDLKSLSL
jgi:hypothetical protein